MANCASCSFADKFCCYGGDSLSDCPTKNNKTDMKIAMEKYDKEYKKFCYEASLQEGTGYLHDEDGDPYPCKTRVQEIIEFSKRMNFKKLGVAFCAAFSDEANIFCKILRVNGFEVVSVICKVGSIEKETIGIKDGEKVYPGKYEPICNPIGQAEVLNSENTDFNILLGLCVGHDSMFLKNSNAMCTVLAAKDRLMAHNPLGAIYTSKTYYKKLTKPLL